VGVVEKARSQIASLIGASPREIIFTSGATESNNLSIKGAAHFYGKLKGNAASSGVKRHIVTTQTEHKCVLDSCRSLEQEGYDVTYLPVEKATGLIDMELLESSLREDTLLVSIMAVNNEIGTRQPLEDIGKMCRKKKILFHTDGEHMRLLYYYFPIVL
jgi:cysteine desulfurase